MTYLQELHRAHAERLRRIEARAFAPKQKPAPRPYARRRFILSAVSFERRQSLYGYAVLIHRYFGLRPGSLSDSTKSDRVTRPRQVCCYLMNKLGNFDFSEIGRRLKKDHTTIMHSCASVSRRRGYDRDFNRVVAELECMCSQAMGDQR